MQDVLTKAELLGRAVASSERFQALRKSEADVQADEEVQKLSEEAEEQARKIRELEQAGSPVEPEDKHCLADLQEKVRAHEKLQALARAQADYAEMMAKVNQTIMTKLSPPKA